MDNNFFTLKRKLSVLATVVVFFITLLVGSGFITYKYFKSYGDMLSKAETYKNTVSRVDFTKFNAKNLQGETSFKELFKNNFIIIDSNWQLLYNYSPYPQEKEYKNIIRHAKKQSENADNFSEDDGYLIGNFPLNNGFHFVSISFLPYSFGDYLTDLGEYFGFLVFLSIFIYFIVFHLVKYLLRPMEENMETMKYFVHVASHELKTPFTSILSSIQLLKVLKTYNQETVEDIESEAKKSGELISGLLELSNISNNSKQEELYISEIFYEVIKDADTVMKKKELHIKIELIHDITLLAHRYYIYMLISNLVSNAIKYNKKGGNIYIIIDDNFFSIKDTGIGIETVNFDKIFQVFYRVSSHRESSEGLGLGLAIVKKIIDLYSWKIEIHSEKSIGTEFIIKM